jgi:hypothetical protein
MALIDKPITERAGYREASRADALQRDLSSLATKHGLLGCVLVQFTRTEVGARSYGVTDKFCDAMDTLATRILTDIDDGRHDPLEHMPAEGRS